MSQLFKGKHLRISTPITKDGMNLEYDKNMRVQYKITYLPFTALRVFSSNNAKKPEHIRSIIDIIEGDLPDNTKEVAVVNVTQKRKPVRRQPAARKTQPANVE